jgi:hypothetical protein
VINGYDSCWLVRQSPVLGDDVQADPNRGCVHWRGTQRRSDVRRRELLVLITNSNVQICHATPAQVRTGACSEERNRQEHRYNVPGIRDALFNNLVKYEWSLKTRSELPMSLSGSLFTDG